MNNLLIFFIFPLATIIISVVLEKAVNSPVSVTAFVFALALVITFIAYTPSELIYAVIYTMIAYIVAVLTCLVIKTCNANTEEEEESFITEPIINNESIVNCNQKSCGCGMRGRR